jgi:multiple sugar transport system permease protein
MTTSARPAPPPGRPSIMRRREAITGILFALPWFIGFLAFTAGPMATSLYLSLTDYSLFAAPAWVGAANYQRLLSGEDELFYLSLWNTAYYVAFAVPLGMLLSLGIALLLNQRLPGVRLWRTIYYLPSVTSGVAVLLLWGWLFTPATGLINQIIGAVGLPEPGWFGDERWSKPAIVIIALWGAGGGMVIYLAGLQAIPRHLYEAAAIDGAGRARQFWHVTLPMLSPTIFFNLIISVIASFQVFQPAYVLTGGGPVNSTLFYVFYLYNQAFQFGRQGYASALAWILLAIVLALTLVNFKLSGRWVYYEGDLKR